MLYIPVFMSCSYRATVEHWRIKKPTFDSLHCWCSLFLHDFFPHYFTRQSYWNNVTLWRLHLPNNGGRYDTASRNGRVSTCLSAGICLNWCSIKRAILRSVHSLTSGMIQSAEHLFQTYSDTRRSCARLTPPLNTQLPMHVCGQSKRAHTSFSTKSRETQGLLSYCGSFLFIKFITLGFLLVIFYHVSIKLHINFMYFASVEL